MSIPENDRPLLLFDGVCGLCNASVDFVMKFDRKEIFQFTPLQGAMAQAILKEFGLPPDNLDSVLLFHNGKLFRESDAILQIARQLPIPFPVVYPFIFLPRFIRDAIYRFIARHRYTWFGKKETCRVPTPEERTRFL